ncbi:hypothetical protein E2562_020820, partial [Oryza meyeriana var. granulata]
MTISPQAAALGSSSPSAEFSGAVEGIAISPQAGAPQVWVPRDYTTSVQNDGKRATFYLKFKNKEKSNEE